MTWAKDNNDYHSRASPLLLDLPQMNDYLLSLLSPDIENISKCFVEAWKEFISSKDDDSMFQTPQTKNEHNAFRTMYKFLTTSLVASTILASGEGGGDPAATLMGLKLDGSRDRMPTRARFTSRLLLYAFLRILVPELYEFLKSKAKVMLSEEDKMSNEQDESIASIKEQSLQQLLVAKRRKRLVLMRIIQFLDGALLPVMRLRVLLSFWTNHSRSKQKNQNNDSHGSGYLSRECGNNLSLLLSGLCYQFADQAKTGLHGQSRKALFVLFAHRRWLQRETTKLVWNICGQGLLTSYGEVRRLMGTLSFSWFLRQRRWWGNYLLRQHQHGGISMESQTSLDTNLGRSKLEPCRLCGKDPIILPYRLELCCESVACYTCVWDKIEEQATRSRSDSEQQTLSCPICYKQMKRCIAI